MRPETLIIAEIGINHNGQLPLAEELVLAAKDTGADIAKFHTYHAEDVMTDVTPLADYMKTGRSGDTDVNDNGFLDLARQVELSGADLEHLKEFAEATGIEFLSSPFDVPSVAFLSDLGVRRLKLPSGELVNPLLLEAAAETGLPLIVSTGMADLDEVRWALQFLSEHHSGPVTLLHCVSQYPAGFEHVNLRALATLRDTFDLPVGYSDHTPGIEAAVAAVALGATVIEKHLTIDRSLPGPDHMASLQPEEFAQMVKAIRNIERALGDGTKCPTPPELVNRQIVRKSLVLRTACPKGTVLIREMLTAKRPGTGIPAIRIDEAVGRRLSRDIPGNALLSENDLE